MDDFGDIIDEQETHPPSRNIQGSSDSFAQDPQQVTQSRKDKVNAAVLRAMPLAERGVYQALLMDLDESSADQNYLRPTNFNTSATD